MNLRKEIETLALWYIPVLIITALVSTMLSEYLKDILAGTMTNLTSNSQNITYLSQIHDLIQLGDNIVVSIWLWLQIKKENGNKTLWAVLGLAANLLAVIIYLCLRVYEQNDRISQGSSSDS